MKELNILGLLFFLMSFPAVGIQMKLEFFQRKFWTASRQVYLKIFFMTESTRVSNCVDYKYSGFLVKSKTCKETTYLK